MCVKFHNEENRLEIIGGASCLYNDIQKLSFQNEDANFKGWFIPIHFIYSIKEYHLFIGDTLLTVYFSFSST